MNQNENAPLAITKKSLSQREIIWALAFLLVVSCVLLIATIYSSVHAKPASNLAGANDAAAPAADVSSERSATDNGPSRGGDQSGVARALHALNPDLKPASSTRAAFSELRVQEVIANGRVVYITEDGRYAIEGPLLDTTNRINLSDRAMAKYRQPLLAKIPTKDRIVFAPAKPKYRVIVFTDIECGFCRKFHDDIAAYNAAGIAVEYLAFPRSGIGSEDYNKMNAVWCAKDPKRALGQAKRDAALGESVAGCSSPVAEQYAIGRDAGLNGTPMIIAEDGTQLGGYLTPEQLSAALQQHEATKAQRI